MENSHSTKTAEIIAAAESVFTEYGYRKVTMDDVALKAGITRTALYYYYKNKEELFLAMLDSEFLRYKAAQESAISKTCSAAEKFSVFAKEYSLLRQKFGSVYRITHADITGNPILCVEMKKRLLDIHTGLLSGILLTENEMMSQKEAEAAGGILARAVRGIFQSGCENKNSDVVKNVVFLLENFYAGLCRNRG